MARARAFRRGGAGVNFAGTLRRSPPPRPISRFAAGAVALACALGGVAERAAAQLDQPLPAPPARETETPAPKLTKPPAITKPVEPVYPPEAFAAGLSGEVALLLTLDAAGRVTAVTVSRAAGHGFDEAAVAAAREMEFSPAEVDGKPAPIRMEYVIHFQPQVVPAPAPPEPEPPAPPPPPALGVGRVVVRGMLRERGSREPLPGADVAVIRRGAGPDGGDLPAEIAASTGADGRFEVRTDGAGPLRIIVSEPGHEPCLRDFTAAELAGPMPDEWSCLVSARDARLLETRVRATAAIPRRRSRP